MSAGNGTSGNGKAGGGNGKSRRNGHSNGPANGQHIGMAEKKAAFIRHLAETGTATKAAKLARMGRRTAYTWRDNDPEFAAAWDDATEEAIEELERSLYERGKGWREPVMDRVGNHVGDKLVYDTTAAIFWLKGARPEKYRERHDHSGSVTVNIAQFFREAASRAREVARN